MLDAFHAEWLKLRGHPATWLLVWLYPIAVALLNLFLILHDLAGKPSRLPSPTTAVAWVGQTTLLLGAPLASQGRWLIAGFAAVAFAGEYGWNTWKLVIPARPRWQLLAAKWVVVVSMLYVALLLADLLMLGGGLIRSTIGGPAIPAGVNAQAIVSAHGQALAHAILPIVYTVAWAAFLAVLTRSMLATAIASIVVISLEQAIGLLAMLASSWAATLTHFLLEVLPLYHVGNVIAYMKAAPPQVVMLTSGPYTASWQTSLAIVLAWLAGLAGFTLVTFQRQDMN